MKTLPVEQLQSFLREARESGVFELYYLELATGLRRGELLGLKWEDIDLERGDLRVRRQISRINGEVVEAPLKTKNAYRTLPLAEDTVSVLLEQKEKAGNSPWVSRHLTAGLFPQTASCTYSISSSLAPYSSPRPTGTGLSHFVAPSLPVQPALLELRRSITDAVQYAGSLLCWVHPGHLRPCDQCRSALGGTNHCGSAWIQIKPSASPA